MGAVDVVWVGGGWGKGAGSVRTGCGVRWGKGGELWEGGGVERRVRRRVRDEWEVEGVRGERRGVRVWSGCTCATLIHSTNESPARSTKSSYLMHAMEGDNQRRIDGRGARRGWGIGCVQGRCRGGAAEVQGRCSGGAGEVQGRRRRTSRALR